MYGFRWRRSIVRIPLLAVVLLAFAAPVAAAPEERPNIVLILADDLGHGDIGVYGQERIRTPFIDQMAREGLRFTDFYAASPVCRPSRYSLLTGLHQGHAFIRSNRRGAEHGTLRPSDRTIARVLQEAGYVTGGFGKWSLGLAGTTGSPEKQGFDHWFGYLDQRRAHRYYVDYLWRNGEKVPTDPRTDYSHDLIMDEALEFVRANHDRPFFVYLAVTLPHADLHVPEDSLAQYQGAFNETPFTEKSPDAHGYLAQPTPRAAYAGMVSRLDRDVGRLLALLGELGIDERTIVFFSSDNGPSAGGGVDPAFFDSSGVFRGGKRDLYEGGIRVPLIARWPGRIQGGETSGVVAAGWDFPSTFAELAGVAPPGEGDGVSLVPALLGGVMANREGLYWESHSQQFSQALRSGRWKIIRPDHGAELELYDLANDAGETKDLASEKPQVVSRLAALMAAEWDESPVYRADRSRGPRPARIVVAALFVFLLVVGYLILRRRS